MSLNKKVLAVAIAGGLFAGSAHAAVDLSAAAPAPVTIASEVNIPTGGLTVTNAADVLTLVTDTNYAFSEGEVRYARIQCSDNMKFPVGVPAPTVAGGVVGAVNGLGTSAIHFSITATALAGIANNAELEVAGDRLFTSRDAVSCEYSLYDQPSQAAAGGATGRIATEQGAYANFASSYLYDITPYSSVASVEADPSFSDFLANTTGTSADIAALGDIQFGTRQAISGVAGSQPIMANGTPSTLAAILAAGTSHVVRGDFSAAANANGSFTGAALSRVYLSVNTDCSTVDFAATAVTATSATFTLGDVPFVDTICYAPRDGVQIPASQYTIELSPVSETGYTAGPLGPELLGTITRDGTELQAPFVQIPGGWYSRIVLTNTSGQARPYSINVLTEEGVTVDTHNLTGTVPANGTKVIEKVGDSEFVFSGNNRATVIVNVAGPSNAIQGLYQIVNPESGSISNHVMVRPDSN